MFKYVAEFLGTCVLLLSILIIGNPLVIGATLAGAAAAGGSISGGHYNPVVSAITLMKGDISSSDFMSYVLSQVLGGLLALEISKRV